MSTETINAIFEGVISLAVIVGAGVLAMSNPTNTALIALASGASSAVIVFWFGQRGTSKAVNGNIAALANIAAQMASVSSNSPPPPTPPAVH